MKRSIPLIIMFILITVTAFVYKESKDIRTENIKEIFAINIPDRTVVDSYSVNNDDCMVRLSVPADSMQSFSNSLSGYEAYSQDYEFPYDDVRYGFFKFWFADSKIYIRNIYVFNEHDNRIEIYMERCQHMLR